MQLGWVLLYFVLGCGVLAALAFPTVPRAIWWRVLRWWRGGLLPDPTVVGFRVQTRWQRWREQSRAGVLPAQHTPRWGRWMLISLVLLLTPVTLTLVWSAWGTRMLDGFDDQVRPGHTQVSQLLAGEQLVPPPPLPPEVFTTMEVEIERPMTASADRRWDRMNPEFVQLLLRVFKVMRDQHGYDMVLLEGYRSPERQAMLAAKGTHVTMAGAYQSYHQFGMAADAAFMRDGRVVISEKDPWAMRGYALFGEVAESMGLTWGGRWQMRDLGHVEWRTPEVRQAMRAARNRAQAVAPAPDTSGNTNTP